MLDVVEILENEDADNATVKESIANDVSYLHEELSVGDIAIVVALSDNNEPCIMGDEYTHVLLFRVLSVNDDGMAVCIPVDVTRTLPSQRGFIPSIHRLLSLPDIQTAVFPLASLKKPTPELVVNALIIMPSDIQQSIIITPSHNFRAGMQ